MNCRSDRKYKVVDPKDPSNFFDCLGNKQLAQIISRKNKWILVSIREDIIGAKIPKV
jgi:uncharacterized membrane protein YqiK